MLSGKSRVIRAPVTRPVRFCCPGWRRSAPLSPARTGRRRWCLPASSRSMPAILTVARTPTRLKPCGRLQWTACRSRLATSCSCTCSRLSSASRGDKIWGKELDHINDGEIDVQCPECGEELLVDLHSDDSPIEPGLCSELAGRLHAEAVQAGRESVATALTHLFGRLSCPGCG